MIKFIQQWRREAKEQKQIDKDGTAEDWTKCIDGLPDTDRKVEVVLIESHWQKGVNPHVTMARFNPGIGWTMDKEGVVVSWRDFSEEMRNLLNDMDLIKRISSGEN